MRFGPSFNIYLETNLVQNLEALTLLLSYHFIQTPVARSDFIVSNDWSFENLEHYGIVILVKAGDKYSVRLPYLILRGGLSNLQLNDQFNGFGKLNEYLAVSNDSAFNFEKICPRLLAVRYYLYRVECLPLEGKLRFLIF